MGKIEICIGFICLAITGGGRSSDSSTLKNKDYEKVIRIAISEIGVREEGCENCGRAVKGYLADVGIKENRPWCAAFVSHCFKKAGYVQPRTPWSPALFPASKIVKEPGCGIIYGIYFANMGRIAHCGLIEYVRNDLVYGVEGNTNLTESREGDGVWRKIRHKRTVHRYADWIK